MFDFTSKNFIITVIFLLSLTIVSVIFSLFLTHGHFTYALDDPYIHMSTIKHFAEQGIWSVDGKTYASASSSPLWVILLTPFYLLFGAKIFVYIPFILNVLFQVLSLSLIFKMVNKYTGHNIHYIFGIMLVLVAPFIALSFGGIEHSLQIFIILLFLDFFTSYIFQPNSNKIVIPLLILAPFVVFVRYENLALVMVMALIILIYFKNWKLSFGLVSISLIFVVIFGLWSKFILNLGFLPSSIIAKSIIGDKFNFFIQINSIFTKFISQLLHPHIITILFFNIFILIKSLLLKKKLLSILSILFILTLLIHLAFAKIGWHYRYEAYLIIFGFTNTLLYIYNVYEINIKWAIFGLLFLFPIFRHQIIGSPKTSILGSKNIYEQQIQMANFLQQQCNSCNIAANDIGAITYFTNIHLLDLYGLGSYEVIKYKKNGTYTNEVKNTLLADKNISLVIVYDTWFKDIILNNYTKIATWKIVNNAVCGGDMVSFYSINNNIYENTIKVKEYSQDKLPNDVIVEFMNE